MDIDFLQNRPIIITNLVWSKLNYPFLSQLSVRYKKFRLFQYCIDITVLRNSVQFSKLFLVSRGDVERTKRFIVAIKRLWSSVDRIIQISGFGPNNAN